MNIDKMKEWIETNLENIERYHRYSFQRLFESRLDIYRTFIHGSFIHSIMIGCTQPCDYTLESIAYAIDSSVKDKGAHWFYMMNHDEIQPELLTLSPWELSYQPYIGFSIPIDYLETKQADQGGTNTLALLRADLGWLLIFENGEAGFRREDGFRILLYSTNDECELFQSKLEEGRLKTKISQLEDPRERHRSRNKENA